MKKRPGLAHFFEKTMLYSLHGYDVYKNLRLAAIAQCINL